MLKIKNYILFLFVSALLLSTWLSNARTTKNSLLTRLTFNSLQQVAPQDTLPDTTKTDTTKADSIRKAAERSYEPSRQSTFEPDDRHGDPFSNRTSQSPLLLENPSSIQMEVEIDTGMDYTIYERIGDVNYRPPTEMTFEEFTEYQNKRMLREYWKTRARGLDGESAVSNRGLIPPIYISPIFDKIFGGSYVDLQPTGFVTLDFGGRWQRVDNPSYPIRQQRNGGFEFDQQINMNVIGQIGDKLKVTANFDNNSSFDFENDFRVEYTGYEEDIIQKIEIGNVSMPVNNSLISGSQNLFGIKTQLRFGRLFVTGVASTQRGSTDMLEIEGGGQVRDFEIRASEYDENRHFFLGHFFRNNYGTDGNQWLSKLPLINSGVNISRVEVYVINRNNDTETQRNFVAFTDLGEGQVIFNDATITSNDIIPTSNTANNLNDLLFVNPQLTRDVDGINDILGSAPFSFSNGQDYEKVNNARKLSEGEYIIDRQLGYISLSRKLQSDEALAVAYEYTYDGQTYKVGELTEDVQNISANQAIFLKLLRPARVDISNTTWDLMMKNIYNLNANQVTRESFDLRVVYRDDQSGIDNPIFQEGGENVKDRQIVELIGADQLNQNGDRPSDGVFDFVEGITINAQNGLIIFPNTQPFGEEISELFPDGPLQEKYVYDTLYNTTKADAEQVAGSNKYFINGSFLSGSANEIMLPGINISEGSVVVTAGNTPLTEGVDYEVDYNLGKVTIISQNLQNENIKIAYEKADLFSFQTRSLLGTRLDYRINDDINIGATLLYLNERPPNTRYRASIGQESLRNTKWGVDINYQKDSRFLTKMVDALPFLETKEISTITFNGEFAQLIPGTSNQINGEGTSYIDDFEASVTPFNLGGSSLNWKLAATPRDTEYVPEANGIEANFRRAKLAWYVIDNAFYRNSGAGTPDHFTEDDLKNHYVRQVFPNEVFPNRDQDQLFNNLPIFELAYYPAERGQYNYNPQGLNPDGTFNDPDGNWGGITRAITSDVDFDKTNIEYIEFWMMDPFINTDFGTVAGLRGSERSGGKLIFNLGTVSEDVLPDENHSFENGLPSVYPGQPGIDYEENPLARLPLDAAAIVNGFSSGNRENQDVGLEGWRGEDEFREYFGNSTPPNLNAEASESLLQDASSDDFRYFLHPEYDQAEADILTRYKRFNNMENNTPIINNENLEYTPIGNSEPDNEDVNNDNTITAASQEQYYEYAVDINRNGLVVGENFIVDKVTDETNEAREPVNWYLFRIPIREAGISKGGISNFKTIRFLRTYLTDFSTPVVLRMAKFQLVGSQWRRFDKTLQEAPENKEVDNPFTVSVVNIEENGVSQEGQVDLETIPYVLPPGVEREQDNTTQYNRRANEQSLQICVENLNDGEANAVYKNLTVDMINYGRLKMFFHAQPNGATPARDNELAAFIRLGTDFENNYYEIEVPLSITENLGTLDAREIWPLENEIDIALEALYALKSARNRERRASQEYQTPYRDVYTNENGTTYNLSIKGRPELSTVQVIMLGVRNRDGIGPDGEGFSTGPKSACIWANELRVADFDRSSGWAANARLNTKLADFANITTSARYTSFGFGGIQQKTAERTRESIKEFDVSANVALDKLLPEKAGLQIPMYLSYRTTLITPQYDPLDPDIPLEAALASIDDSEERDNYEKIMQDNTVRRGINFTNVRKVKTNEEAKDHIYDIENFAFSYAYSDILQQDHRTESYKFVSQRASIAYNYVPKELIIAPFKNVKLFSSPYLALFKDFNFSPVPANLAFRADLVRTFAKTQLRNADLTTFGIEPTFEKSFIFNRFYDVRWNLTQGLSLDYNARANAIIDEPYGDLSSEEKRNEVLDNLKNLGRMRTFDQSVALNYRLPLDKIPFTDWISADLRFAAGYNWTAGSFNPYLADSIVSLKELYGNTIQNTREQTLTGNMDLTKLYNKVKVLNEINAPPRRRGRNEEADTVKSITDQKFLTGFLKVLMSVKSINMTYSVREGTMLPGFEKDIFLFGMDSSFSAPGIPFLLGSQNPEIRREAALNGWLIDSAGFINSFSQTQTVDLNIRANVEPVKDLRIQVDARKLSTAGYRENFSISENGNYNPISPNRFGSYSISFIGIKTAFVTNDDDESSPIFRDFDNYRTIIKERVSEINPSNLEYNENNQDILIPAFVAAYTGKSPNDVDLTPFPQIPLPNWRVDYAGLSKIAALSSIFSSINLTHSYNASYTINNYVSSSQFTDSEVLSLDNSIVDYPLSQEEGGRLSPLYAVSQVVISERFAPLIGINVRTRSRLNARIEYRKERNISLNVANAQVAELNSNDILIDFGFTKANIRLPFRTKGRTTVLKNDLTFRVGLTIRDTETVQRRLSAPQSSDSTNANNVITSGNINYQLRPTLDYVLNQRLNLQLYFERTINEPKISSSFRRSTTAFGTKLTFNLAQ